MNTTINSADSFDPTARADLHLHTTYSDGIYTPGQIVDLARRTGLAAIAVTDHDTLEGIQPAQEAACDYLEVVPAVELSARYRSSVFHLLGYFIDPEDQFLRRALSSLCRQRKERFGNIVQQLRSQGLSVDCKEIDRSFSGNAPSRRHLAQWLVETKQAQSLQQAFDRYLGDDRLPAISPIGLPVREAIDLVRGAGGVAVWAHPSYDCRQKNLKQLVEWGLQGIEIEYPGYRPNRVKQLRQLAADFGLAVSGGSDCHGPMPSYQCIGARSISMAELEEIRSRSEPAPAITSDSTECHS